MKGNKKVLTLAVLVLLLAVCFTTYAIYRQSASGTGTLNAAAWSVKVNGTDIASANFDFDFDDITWTTLTGYNDTISPGSEGYIEIPVDALGSEVDVILSAELGTLSGLPTGMTVALASGAASQTIPYSTSSMSATVRINVAWAGAESDDSTKDTNDLSKEGATFSIPVTLTAKQSLVSHS